MTAPHHFCVVTETYPPEINGVALTLGHLVRGLRERGRRVSLVRPRQRRDDGASPPDTTLVSGAPLSWFGGVQVGWPARHLLGERWSAERPHAVYVATEGPLGWSAVHAARALAIPVLSGFHSNFHQYARHYRAGHCASLVFRYLRRLHNATCGTLVASHDLRDQLAAAGFRNLHVLGRGVDAALFTPARRSAALREAWGAGGEGPVALHVGRLAPEKNIALAIDGYRAMQRANPSTRLVIVGDGPLRGALQRAHPDVIFPGSRIGADLATHYASADVFLFPSETETFGNVTLEAMASGLAVVAFDHGAARTHLVHGVSGVLVPGGAAAAFVREAAALAGAPRSIACMGRRAREASVRVDWATVVEGFEGFLDGSGDRAHGAEARA